MGGIWRGKLPLDRGFVNDVHTAGIWRGKLPLAH